MKTTSRRVLAGLLALALTGCGAPAVDDPHDDHGEDEAETHRIQLSPEAMASAGIGVETVGRRAVEPTIEATGRLDYDERRMAVATARIGGRVTQVVADYGARVDAGQTLAWIDSPELGAAQAEYRRALVISRVHEAEYRRAELLLEGEAISRGEMVRREGRWQAARAELEAATQALHLLGLSRQEVDELAADDARPSTVYPVRAPIAGKVTERMARAGEVVASDTRLFVVAQLDELWLTLQLFEKDLPAVAVGAPVSLECESHPEDRFDGRIDFVADVVDPHSRTIAARAVIANPERKLKPGMFVNAEVTGANDGAAPEVLALPASALARIEARDVAFVAQPGGVFERREIEVGRRWGDWAEVVAGLEAGEEVATTGVFTLKSELLKGGLEGHAH